MATRPLGPTVSQRILGAELRMHRERIGLSCKEVGDRLSWSETKVSRFEKARNSIHRNDLRLLIDMYQLPDAESERLFDLVKPRQRQRGWWNDFRDVVPERRWVYVRLEDEAEQIRSYDIAYIPGLLQTEAYAETIMSIVDPGVSAEVKNRRVAVRQARQHILHREFPVVLKAVVDEAVLLRTSSLPRKVGTEQLDRLAQMAQLSTVELRVLPLQVGVHAGMDGSFTLIDFPEPAEPVVFLETRTAGNFIDEPSEIGTFSATYDRLKRTALSPKRSLDFIQTLRQNPTSRTVLLTYVD